MGTKLVIVGSAIICGLIAQMTQLPGHIAIWLFVIAIAAVSGGIFLYRD